MQYTITNIHYPPIELDDEIIFIEFTVHLSKPEIINFDSSLPLKILLTYVKQNHPSFYTYWSGTRKSLDLFGPAEVSTLEAIGEEAREQLTSFLIEYIGTNRWIELTYEHHKKLGTKAVNDENGSSQDAMAADMKESASGIRETQQRYRQFCEQVTSQVRRIAMELYPELENMDTEKLRTFQYLFADEIIGMEEELCKFCNNIV